MGEWILLMNLALGALCIGLAAVCEVARRFGVAERMASRPAVGGFAVLALGFWVLAIRQGLLQSGHSPVTNVLLVVVAFVAGVAVTLLTLAGVKR